MSSATDILAGILPDRLDRLTFAVTRLRLEFFTDSHLMAVWTLMVRYYDRANGVLPRDTFMNMVEQTLADPSRSLLYLETYDALVAKDVSDAAFRWAVGDIVDLFLKRQTGHALATAVSILETGADIDGKTVKGQEEAREYLAGFLAEADSDAAREASPEGDILRERNDLIKEYITAKNEGDKYAVRCGITSIDRATGGFKPGELILVVAASGAGKSHFCIQTAWWASVMEGKNVFFATTETHRDVIRRRLYARHSRHSKFGLVDYLDSNEMRQGRLSQASEEVLHVVSTDMAEGDYGKLWIAQVPHNGTLEYIRRRVQDVSRSFQIDLVVIDYLMLLKSAVRRQSRREELNETITQAKSLATSFADGAGVPVISPWQVNRENYKEARGSGSYNLSALAETSEAEKAADFVVALFVEDNNANEGKFQVLKNRDGPVPPAFRSSMDYKTSWFEDRQQADQALEELI